MGAGLALAMWFVDLLLPRRCAGCGAAAELLCPACFATLRVLRHPRCDRCGAPTAWPVERCRECSGRRLAFETARAAIVYAPPVPALVRGWKERGLRRVASLAADLVDAHVERPEADVITWIPPDPARQLRRSEHPAASLARELAVRWDLSAEPLLRRRAHGTMRRQTGLTLAERRRNVRDAFTVAVRRAAPTLPERVVLVDDVYTTGATASAAAAALRTAGVARVDVVTFARTGR